MRISAPNFITCLIIGILVSFSTVRAARADPRVFTAKDLTFYDSTLRRWSAVIIAGVNKVAHDNPECVEAEPMSADLTDEGTAKNPVFFVACLAADGRPFNAKFSADDVSKQTTLGQTFPISQADAMRVCSASVKARAAHPSTVDFSTFWSARFYTFPNGRTRFETKFSARNAFNLKVTFRVACYFDGRKMTAIDISESD